MSTFDFGNIGICKERQQAYPEHMKKINSLAKSLSYYQRDKRFASLVEDVKQKLLKCKRELNSFSIREIAEEAKRNDYNSARRRIFSKFRIRILEARNILDIAKGNGATEKEIGLLNFKLDSLMKQRDDALKEVKK